MSAPRARLPAPGILVGLALALGLVSPASVGATQGVRVNVGQIDVHDHLEAGRVYHLPDLEVSNPGTESASYEMLAAAVAGQEGAPLEPAWIGFEPTAFELDPGQVQRVAVTITIPIETKPATYGGILKAQLAQSGSGVAVGAAAGARISFTTAPPASTLDAIITDLRGFLDATQPWPLVALIAIAALLAGRIVLRRWDIRIQRR